MKISGSLDFNCDVYGGQCKCRKNVIGRRCDKCAPGFYKFPDCIKCNCKNNQLCDEFTGQCLCPRFVEGRDCDHCETRLYKIFNRTKWYLGVQYAYGFDPLIGCQLCGCNYNGSANGQLICDERNGQCLCKENVGGRQCDRCLPGYFGFPTCNQCACEEKGTTDDICDDKTAQCLCKV